ncbi:MAG: MCP four helix bundle domain-containing protein [Candidatus Cyclobacteriaceae bacterium M2_1C_046]
MKWFFNIPQKFKTSLLLLVIVVTVLSTSFWGNSMVLKINESFSSIYKDRLLPANELFHLSDLFYQKRLLMQEFVHKSDAVDKTYAELNDKNQQIDSILHDYEQTYLVTEESRSLIDLKGKIKQLALGENRILLNPQNSAQLIEQEMIPLFHEIRTDLIILSEIQTTVGKELLNGSETFKANSSFIHYCQLTMLLIILIIVQGIIFSAKSIIPKKPQRFNLN